MRLIFCGGGTAGHVTPAIAIAEHMKGKYPDAELLYVGRMGGEENLAVKKRGIPIAYIDISGFERHLSLKNVKNAVKAVKSLGCAKRIIKEFKPDAVIGTGGYVCWPILRCASKMQIPTLIHESNATAGLVTRLLSKSADRVLLNYEIAKDELKRKDNVRVVGNPVIASSSVADKKSLKKSLNIPEDYLLISSYGGSGGSKILNDRIIELMKSYGKNEKIAHLHSSGTRYFKQIQKEHPTFTNGNGVRRILPYIENAPGVMAVSDVVISRCGAMTIAELASCGAAAILIPSPNVANNHQYKNAKMLEEEGAAILIEEKELTDGALFSSVRSLISSKNKRNSLSEKIRKFYSADSKEKIEKEIIFCITGR